jgi:hypothetical protein
MANASWVGCSTWSAVAFDARHLGAGFGHNRLLPTLCFSPALLGRKTMYFSPVPRPGPVPRRPGDAMKAIGGPQTSAALKRDPIDASSDYRKPGRSASAETSGADSCGTDAGGVGVRRPGRSSAIASASSEIAMRTV